MTKIKQIIRSNLNLIRLRANLEFNNEQIRIVIGAGGNADTGWSPTDIEFLNLLKESDWQRFFGLNSIDAMLAEHVWEHLTDGEAREAAKRCYAYLKRGGYIRVAVPDGNHPNEDYIKNVKVNGAGPGADDHKVLYTYQTLSELFQDAGFQIELLEYFDEKGVFQYNVWNPENGTIRRSKWFEPRNVNGNLVYTSIIIDAFKR
jgi:predicted SAM-dependent methyltransferase